LKGTTRTNRIFAYGCMDWTERRPHLGGSLGAAVLQSILASGILKRERGKRTLKQIRPLSSWIVAIP
jgi:hypothetical protein